MLDQARFQAQMQAIVDRAAKHKGTRQAPCTESQGRRLAMSLTWALYVGVPLIAAASWVAWLVSLLPIPAHPPPSAVTWCVVLGSTLLGAILIFALGSVTVEPHIKTPGSVPFRIMRRYINTAAFLVARSLPISTTQAESIVTICQATPAMTECCARWIATNRGHKLTQRECIVLATLHRRLSRLQDQWEREAADRQCAEQADTILNQLGVVDRGRALAQSAALSATTVKAASHAPPPRL